MPKNRMMKWLSTEKQSIDAPSAECIGELRVKIGDLAIWIDKNIAEGAEKTAGMRKLVEAKDCLVRAVIEEQEG